MFVVVFGFHKEADRMEDLERGQKKYVFLLSYFVRSSNCAVQHKSFFTNWCLQGVKTRYRFV